MLLLAALVMIALGLACGVALVLAPFGLLPTAGLSLWLLFPLLLVAGYLLFVAPASLALIRTVSRLASSLLLLLALGAAGALVLDATGLAVSTGSTTSLWYVLAIGILLGPLGMLAHRGRPAAP